MTREELIKINHHCRSKHPHPYNTCPMQLNPPQKDMYQVDTNCKIIIIASTYDVNGLLHISEQELENIVRVWNLIELGVLKKPWKEKDEKNNKS